MAISDAQVVLIESLSNQAFIFSSNKLREIVGASELIHAIGARIVLGAALPAGGAGAERSAEDIVLDPAVNRPLSDGGACEIVVAASGKAILLARDASTARGIVAHVTAAMLREAPGLGVMGAFVSADLSSAAALQASIARVHRRLERLRATRPPVRADLLRLPFAADCRSTGEAAAGFDPKDPEQKDLRDADPLPLYSEGVLARRRAAPAGVTRLAEIFGEGVLDLGAARDVDDGGDGQADAIGDRERLKRGDDEGWTAIVHADGNGLGQVFLDFAPRVALAHAQATDAVLLAPEDLPARVYIDWLRRFSIALDRCTRAATKAAVDRVWPSGNAGLRPVVLAGDDLTVQCNGAKALAFTLNFMEAFEALTQVDDVVSRVLARRTGEAFERRGVRLAAGIAIVKAHHPFHRAYELAEQLVVSAKRIKDIDPEASAFDLHVSYDGVSDLDIVRERMQRERGDGGLERTYGGPYRLGAARSLAERREIFSAGDLEAAVLALRGTVGDKEHQAAALPRGQQHVLRSAVLQGREAADAALARIRHRYASKAAGEGPDLDALAGADGLFAPLGKDGDAACLLLDALAIVDVAPDAFQPSGGEMQARETA